MFDVKKCAECGKDFIMGPNYLYKLRRKNKTAIDYYCCYKHWQKNGGDGGVRVIKYGN